MQCVQVGSHLQHSVYTVFHNEMDCRCVYRKQDSLGSVGGCGCGSVVDGELWVLTHGTAAVGGGRTQE